MSETNSKHELLFILTIPGVGSGVGMVNGQSKLYCQCRNAKVCGDVKDGQYRFRWDDGWEACISVSHIGLKESRKFKKASSGFYGYEWMINSIIANGEIRKPVSNNNLNK